MNIDLTPDRFFALWTSAGSDEFPFPLRYRSTAMWEDEHAAALRAADAWIRDNHTPDLERAVGILLTGEPIVEVYGPGPDSIFLLAAVRDGHAVLARQTSETGDIGLTTTTVENLARLIADALPHVPAGCEPERNASTREVVEPSDSAAVRRTIDDTDARALRRLLQRERTATGSIRVLVRASVGYTSVADLGWFDVAGDGRYLFVPGEHMRVAPATVDLFRTELAARIERATRLSVPPAQDTVLRPY